MFCTLTGSLIINARSAAYSSLKDYHNSVADANKTVQLKPDWAKGYSRQGASLHGLGNLKESVEAYKKGLEIDPSNAVLKKGLEDVEEAIEAEGLSGLGSIFGPDMWTKMASNPKLSPFLADPTIVEKLQQIQKNPKNMGAFMQDPRMMQIMMGLMGLDGMAASNAEEMEQAKSEAEANLDARAAEKEEHAAKHQKVQEEIPTLSPEEELADSNRKKSDELKVKGTECYKQKKFEDALKDYDAAYEADNTNIAVLTNKSGIIFI